MWKLSFVLLVAATTQSNGFLSIIPDPAFKFLTIPEKIVLDISPLANLQTIKNFKEMSTGFGIFNLGTEVQKMQFKLKTYRRNYSEEILTPETPLSFTTSSWDKTQKTIIVVHGYTEDGSGGLFSTTSKIIDAYEKAKRTENLIFVDWRHLARQADYFTSAKNTIKAGMRVAELIITLRNSKFIANLENVHLVGFSLGAHVCGVAAYCTNSLIEGEKIGRITGLDPAGPGFRDVDNTNRLDASDAKFVDVIHTNMGKLITTFGLDMPLGHVDFYPNGGHVQPGCTVPLLGEVVGVCSHTRAPEYFSNTILGTKYIGCLCSDWDTFKKGNCQCTNGAIMGEYVNPSSAPGNYYLAIV